MLPSTLKLNTSLPGHATLLGSNGDRIMPRAYLRQRFAYWGLLSWKAQTTLRRTLLGLQDEGVQTPDDH